MRKLIMAVYWVAALFMISAVVRSLGYTFVESLFMASFFLPGVFLALYFHHRMSLDASRKPLDMVYVGLAVIVLEILLTLSAHSVVLWMRGAFQDLERWSDMPDILVNPFFIVIVDTFFILLNGFLWSWLGRKFPDKEVSVTFFSDRSKVRVDVADILYVESNDTVTNVILAGGKRFRNKTSISRWEDILGEPFIRVHRSYLVRKDAIEEVTSDSVKLGQLSLPLSRSHRDNVRIFYQRKLLKG